jgi:hypothetical protein
MTIVKKASDPGAFFVLEVQHLDRCQGGLFAFIAVFAAGAVEGLLFVEGG